MEWIDTLLSISKSSSDEASRRYLDITFLFYYFMTIKHSHQKTIVEMSFKKYIH